MSVFDMSAKLSGKVYLTVEAECKEQAEALFDDAICRWLTEGDVGDLELDEAYCDLETTEEREDSLMKTLPTGYWEESN